MEYVIYTNGIINWRGFDFTYESCEKIDDICVHVSMSEGIYAFVGGETTINRRCSGLQIKYRLFYHKNSDIYYKNKLVIISKIE